VINETQQLRQGLLSQGCIGSAQSAEDRQRARRLFNALLRSQISIIDSVYFDVYDAFMRTTLTIDDDLLAQIEDLQRREGLSFKGAVNRLLRAGIQFQAQPPKRKPYRTPSRKLGLRAGLDPTKLNQFVDEMDADEFMSAGNK
jgi:hypothetical protein